MVNQTDRYSDIYPGIFLPDSEISTNSEEMKKDSPVKKVEPKVLLQENEDIKEVWIELPGISKSEIIITLENRTLLVQASHHRNPDIRRYEARIRVPTHADPWFIHAEYEIGMLKIKIPMASEQSPMINRSIIIY